jgi:hypothetical protein
MAQLSDGQVSLQTGWSDTNRQPMSGTLSKTIARYGRVDLLCLERAGLPRTRPAHLRGPHRRDRHRVLPRLKTSGSGARTRRPTNYPYSKVDVQPHPPAPAAELLELLDEFVRAASPTSKRICGSSLWKRAGIPNTATTWPGHPAVPQEVGPLPTSMRDAIVAVNSVGFWPNPTEQLSCQRAARPAPPGRAERGWPAPLPRRHR